MKTISVIITTAILLLMNTAQVVGQEYHELLQPVFLDAPTGRTVQQITPADLHSYLLQKEDFSFRSEIKTARKYKAKVVIDESNLEDNLSTANYLRTLRRLGNKSATLEQFTSLLSEELSVTKSAVMALEDIEALYDVIRQNTFYGKLDIVGAELTWL